MGAQLKKATDTATADVSTEPGLSFRAPTLDLKRATALLARVADAKSTMPILQHVAMRVEAGRGVTLVATDLNITAIVRLPLHDTAMRGGGFCVNAKALADIVKRLPPDECEISRKGMLGLAVTSGSLASILHGTPDRDFPKIPDDDNADKGNATAWHTCEADELATMFDSVAYAVCKDETRFHLSGVFYECDQSAITVATDGHRLALTRGTMSGPKTKGVIVPAKGAREIVKLLSEGKRKGTCQMAIHGLMVFVRYGAVTLAIRCIDAQFPPYMQVVPKDHKKLATIERKPLIEALKRAATLCTETRGVKLSFASGTLTLVSDHPDTGEARETVPTESLWCESGATFEIGVNARYMLDALAEIDCKHVTLAMGSELDPVVLRSTEYAVSFSVAESPHLNVTMPMRI